ncbi:MAG: class GN sortase [Acidobacteria bacterium]|nr:class GN sortase [Acidobacteriota bacterium]
MSSRTLLAVGLMLAAAFSLGQAGWIHTKALAAQWLLERAWVKVQDGAADARPWPWADTAPVAELAVPRLDQRLLVLDAASGRTLAFGPAHVAGSAPPGGFGNSVLTGHRDTHFAFLRHLRSGDLVEIRDRSRATVSYRVESIVVVRADELRLTHFAPRRELTLVTCYPFDTVTAGGPWRLVVRATETEVVG